MPVDGAQTSTPVNSQEQLQALQSTLNQNVADQSAMMNMNAGYQNSNAILKAGESQITNQAEFVRAANSLLRSIARAVS